MNSYTQIPGPKKFLGLPCIAFAKYDGSNFRAEWSKKRGWYKFGTRTQIIDRSSQDFGKAIDVFMEKQAGPIEQVLRTDKSLPTFESALVFCEYVGPQSFAGQHDKNKPEEMDMVLFDVNLHKRGIMLPKDFLYYFGHLKVPAVVYQGPLNDDFIQEVRQGKYGENEGVVVKGVNQKNKKNDLHGLWFAKIKTNWWLEQLKRLAADNVEMQNVLNDNLLEQGLMREIE